eukprot:TRINITY_DN16762_c0_g1_i1.p1 TRINITY_DN16762_c0_g1~~TRINITY_DN16762_c0_g1_i1.p1  ORF type:complete len:222 (+),score=5.97 TRINITY_DN16762_c0_g1_i1:111-776(+)
MAATSALTFASGTSCSAFGAATASRFRRAETISSGHIFAATSFYPSQCASLALGRGHVSSLQAVQFGSTPFTSGLRRQLCNQVARRSSARQAGVRASSDSDTSDVGAGGLAAIGFGLVSVPVMAWSLFTLKTTGCGLPPGPGGALGGLEGISYLAIVGIVGWSLYTKVKTGSGLPQGPFGLLGAVEGLSYLLCLAGLVVLGFQVADHGFIPSPTPDDRCFG